MSETPPTLFAANVDLIQLESRKIYLVGTAHVSQSSVDLAEQVIREVRPDHVAVELCESRFQSLKDPSRWKNLDLFKVIREGKAYVLLAQLMLAAFQKKLGNKLNITPGAEMMRAIAVAEETGATLVLADREVRVTLKRAWSALGFWSFMKLLFSLLTGIADAGKIDQKEIERLKQQDALDEIMKEFSEQFPAVRCALIDERDTYLAMKIKRTPGACIVAVVGAGHVAGIKREIEKDIDLTQLEKIPPPGIGFKIFIWAIPVSALAIFAYGFFISGAQASVDLVTSWIWATGLFAALGSLLMLAHPLTILAAFVAAPFATIRAGWAAGLVEALVRRPRVSDMESILEDFTSVRGMFRNRVLRILFITAFTNLFAIVGTLFGVAWIASILRSIQ